MKIDKKFKDISIYEFGFWHKYGRDYVYISPHEYSSVLSETDGLTPDGVSANYELDSTTHKVLRKFKPLARDVPEDVWKNRVFF